jgi:hypothetical protein
MAVANSIQSELDEAEHVIRQQMARIAELEIEVERLKANASAHQTLASIYADPNQPTGHRIRAATAALACETPRLESVPPPLDLVAEEIIPLAELVEKQRARADAMLREARNIEVSPSGAVRILPASGSNGGGDGDD